jgi:type II secretion system protein C
MPSMPQPVRSEGSSRSQVAIGVTERNIFGIEKSLPMLATAGEYSDSGFGGKLTGVLLGSTLASSRASVVDSGGHVLVVKSEANPNAPEGAPVYLLTDIGKDFAVVSFNGQERSLRLEAGDTSSAPPSGASMSSSAPAVAGVTSSEQDHYMLERGALTEQLSDINMVISSMLVSPAYNNGEFLGYRVTRMREDAPLQALGIQRGDIINRINGEELTNPQILFDMLGKVGEINAISLDVTRGADKKTIFVEIQ